MFVDHDDDDEQDPEDWFAQFQQPKSKTLDAQTPVPRKTPAAATPHEKNGPSPKKHSEEDNSGSDAGDASQHELLFCKKKKKISSKSLN